MTTPKMDEIRLYNRKRLITTLKHIKAENKPKWTLYRHTATADNESRKRSQRRYLTGKRKNPTDKSHKRPYTATAERQTRKPTPDGRKRPYNANCLPACYNSRNGKTAGNRARKNDNAITNSMTELSENRENLQKNFSLT